MVSINQITEMVMKNAGKKLSVMHIAGPTGVRGRKFDEGLSHKELDWEPRQSLFRDLKKTYPLICRQFQAATKESMNLNVGTFENCRATQKAG